MRAFFALFVFLILVAGNSFGHTSSAIEKMLTQVYGLDFKPQNEWSDFEKKAYRAKNATPRNSFPRVRREKDCLVASNFDPLSPTGIFETRYHLTSSGPPLGISDSLDFLNYHGVVFSLQKGVTTSERNVYLGRIGDKDLEKLRDTIRISIVDNPFLNPWHRAQQLGLRTRKPSEPQQELIDFFYKLYRNDQLKEGALGQLPTGMGKTYAVLALLKKIPRKSRPRIAWFVHGKTLVDQSYNVFSNDPVINKEKIFRWHSDVLLSSTQVARIASGGYDHLFVSSDSIPEGSSHRIHLENWVKSKRNRPTFFIFDEVHQVDSSSVTADSVKEVNSRENLLLFVRYLLRKSLLANKSGYIGLSATPEIEDIDRYFPHKRYAFLGEGEITYDGVPKMGFLSQILLASQKGYVPVPLFYRLENSPDTLFDKRKGNSYTGDTLEKLKYQVQAAMPGKIIVFHPPGPDDKGRGTNAMLQFNEYLKDVLGANYPTFFLKGTMSRTERENVLIDFTSTRQGVLNLTSVGSVGLDIPDVDCIILVDPRSNQKIVLQRIGRSTRARQHKTFYRVIDFTGKNFDLLTEEVIRRLLLSGESRRKVRELLAQYNQAPGLSLISEIYRTCGIDIDAIKASKEFFVSSLREINRAIEKSVLIREKYESELPSPQPRDTLRTYIQRPEVLSRLVLILNRFDETQKNALFKALKPKLTDSDFEGLKKLQDSLPPSAEHARLVAKFIHQLAPYNAAAILQREVFENETNLGVLFKGIRADIARLSTHFTIYPAHAEKMPKIGEKQKMTAYLRNPKVLAYIIRLCQKQDGDKFLKRELTEKEETELAALERSNFIEDLKEGLYAKYLNLLKLSEVKKLLEKEVFATSQNINVLLKNIKKKYPHSESSFSLSSDFERELTADVNFSASVSTNLKNPKLFSLLLEIFDRQDNLTADPKEKIFLKPLTDKDREELKEMQRDSTEKNRLNALYGKFLFKFSQKKAGRFLETIFVGELDLNNLLGLIRKSFLPTENKFQVRRMHRSKLPVVSPRDSFRNYVLKPEVFSYLMELFNRQGNILAQSLGTSDFEELKNLATLPPGSVERHRVYSKYVWRLKSKAAADFLHEKVFNIEMNVLATINNLKQLFDDDGSGSSCTLELVDSNPRN